MFGASDSSITFGRIAGAPVRIGPGSVLIAAFVAYSLGAQWIDRDATVLVIITAALTGIGFMGSILAHEAGHAVVAKRNGISSREIRLSLFGGVAALERGAPDPGSEMRVAFAGPAVNLLVAVGALGGAFAFARTGADSILLDAIIWLGAINLILGVFNLLPGLPLDGGRILTGFLWRRRGNRAAAVRTTANVGKGLAYIAFAIGAYELVVAQSPFGIYTAFIGLILLRGADGEVARVSLVEQVKGRSVGDVARYQPPVINESVNTASARALLPTPDPTQFPASPRWAIVTDDDGIARGLLDLLVLDRAATADGTNPVASVMLAIDQQRAAFESESLEGVIDRGVMVPFVVIDPEWRPVALVDHVGAAAPV
jgi:Zn-dependent protease